MAPREKCPLHRPGIRVKSWTQWQRRGLGKEWSITDLGSSLLFVLKKQKTKVDSTGGRRSKMHLHKHWRNIHTYTHTLTHIHTYIHTYISEEYNLKNCSIYPKVRSDWNAS